MEEFTNLKNYPVPFEPSLVKAVIAEEVIHVFECCITNKQTCFRMHT